MSTHPNVILMAVLTPEGLSRKTAKAIAEKYDNDGYATVNINDKDYFLLVMEDSYDESHQISAKEGDIVIFDLVTYGYGESIAWDMLTVKKNALEEWAKNIAAKNNCKYEIKVSANYW